MSNKQTTTLKMHKTKHGSTRNKTTTHATKAKPVDWRHCRISRADPQATQHEQKNDKVNRNTQQITQQTNQTNNQ